MATNIDALLPLFNREKEAGRALALAVVLDTEGSTYSKRGSLLLIAGNGDYAGLLSGGCLEGDLVDRARAVISTGAPCTAQYDSRGDDDLLFGLGSGCEGAMRVFLMRLALDNQWQPLADLQNALHAHIATTLDVQLLPDTQRFTLSLELPPRILLLGAGADAVPVNTFAQQLRWKLTLCDHRPANIRVERFPGAMQVLLVRADALGTQIQLSHFDAAIVMSHHLPSDLHYLRALGASHIEFIGLLGPAARRQRLREALGTDNARLEGRLHAPVGLALGGGGAASIALGIVAQLHAWWHGRAASGKLE
jgi:xanthine/CO dehydrogenase XdhC/CoxF family maturation factor